MLRLVQIIDALQRRCVARVDDDQRLRLLPSIPSIYDLAMDAISEGASLASVVGKGIESESDPVFLNYDDVVAGDRGWRLLPSIDHPADSARCLVTGTGLTHKTSAENRQAMHAADATKETDSMKMFRWGLEGGRPKNGDIGTQPEWFYKGRGEILRASGDPLAVPSYALDGGDEAEIAGVYVIAPDGRPFRIGLTQGNEFSDHILEAKNYLYLATSKLRPCAIGPELIIGHPFEDVRGQVMIQRCGQTFWSAAVRTGEANMSHTVQNLEYHHFKSPEHRQPGDVHIHFFGADAFSYRNRVVIEDGDEIHISFEGFGRPLCNRILVSGCKEKLVRITQL